MNGRTVVRRGRALLAALALLGLTGCCATYYRHMACGGGGRYAMTLAEREVRDATNRFLAALDAMFIGNLYPLSEVWSHADDVTLMSPFGGRVAGWAAVREQYLRESKIGLSGRVTYADLLVRVAPDGQTAWTVGRIVGDGMRRGGLPVMVDVRATSVWRLEAGHWRLAHHHADAFPPAPAQ